MKRGPVAEIAAMAEEFDDEAAEVRGYASQLACTATGDCPRLGRAAELQGSLAIVVEIAHAACEAKHIARLRGGLP